MKKRLNRPDLVVGQIVHLIRCFSEDGTELFLVDRSRTRLQWWTSAADDVMCFRSLDAAETSLQKLKYREPEIVRAKVSKTGLMIAQAPTLASMLAQKQPELCDSSCNSPRDNE